MLAVQLAILEKSASGLGALGFIWATVVLLGGFAITLEKADFWFITVILLIEGTRIFSRSHELEWQHEATWSLAEVSRSSFRAMKSTTSLLARSAVRVFGRSHQISGNAQCAMVKSPAISGGCGGHVPWILADRRWSFLSRNLGKVFYSLQMLSAAGCVFLSSKRLVEQHFGDGGADGAENRTNRNSALDIFYGLALAEALLFLAEKAMWEYKVSYGRILEGVNSECQLGAAGMFSVKRFFYDAYSRSVNGSVFDGLKMDMATFALELLVSNSLHEQVVGARILGKFSNNPKFSDSTLRMIGTSSAATERLVEMLNWKHPTETEIRRSAAIVVSKLASRKRNALRLAGIPGSMESISSLLSTPPADPSLDDFTEFNLLGLLIIKKLAHDHDNCVKIGYTRGLLDKIIGFTSITAARGGPSSDDVRLKAVKRSLQVIKMLAGTSGHAGKALRREISDVVFAVSNMRGILRSSDKRHVELQRLAVEAMTNIAMDEAARERIGSTGGVLRELLRKFLCRGDPAKHEKDPGLRVEAGEALAMLALESAKNCERILKEEDAVERLVSALADETVKVGACTILRNLCCYADVDWCCRLRRIVAGAPTVLNAIMAEKSCKLVEVSLGLAAQMVRFTNQEELTQLLDKAGIRKTDLVQRMVNVLAKHEEPSIQVPRIRRHVIELVISMLKTDRKYSNLFSEMGMEEQLRSVASTTSELECFHVFSGSAGLSRHNVPLTSLVESALELISSSSK